MDKPNKFNNQKVDWKKKIYKSLFCRVGIVYLLCVVIGLAIPAFYIYGKKRICGCECISLEFRINCLPDKPISHQTKKECDEMRCCWHPINDSLVPPCFHKHPTETEHYLVTSNQGSYISAKLHNNVSSASYDEVNMKIEHCDEHHLRVVIFDQEESGYEIFNKTCNRQFQNQQLYAVTFPENNRLNVEVWRRKGNKLFDTSFGPLIYRRDYVEFSTYLPSYNIYGLGQRKRRNFGLNFVEAEQWVLYSRFRSNTNQSDNFPGVHPFYLCMEANGDAHGVLLETARPAEVTVTAGPLLTVRIMGGNLDIHFFPGPSPSDVIRQMQTYVGKPSLPPYWALGHHICNSINLSHADSNIRELRKRNVSQESDCGTVNLREFFHDNGTPTNQLRNFLQALSNNNQKFLILQTPYKSEVSDYSTESYFSFVLKGSSCLGKLFNETVAYLDFFNEETKKHLKKQLQYFFNLSELYSKISFGILLNYNTPVNTDNKTTKCNEDHFKFLPGRTPLSSGTVCWNCSHSNISHYKLHNLYGYKHMESIWEAWKEIQLTTMIRPFILSLSTFLGSGKYGGSWGGPNNATWEDLRQAVANMLEFNTYGIPMSGDPYCGYYGDSDQDLCSRWLQVSTLSPLTISYRGPGQKHINLTQNGLVSSVGKMAVQLKYSLLPYFYSLFYEAFLHGGTVVRPLFFEFRKDAETYHLDSQYMWGPSLLVSPVLTPKTNKVNAYFPKGCWYDYHVGTKYHMKNGQYVELPAIESHINLHMLGGRVILGRTAALTVAESLNKSFTLTVALNCSKIIDPCDENEILASGEFYIDDGASMDYNYTVIKVEAWNMALKIYPKKNGLTGISNKLELIRLFGIVQDPSKIMINNVEIAHKGIKSSRQRETLNIKHNLNIVSDNVIEWEYEFCKRRQKSSSSYL